MWIFLPFGFFSVVSHRQRPKNVLIRARSYQDAEALRKYFDDVRETLGCGLGREFKRLVIETTPRADYRFRIEMVKEEFSTILDMFVNEELNYDNFKNAVSKQDPARARLYNEVWRLLREELQPDPEYGEGIEYELSVSSSELPSMTDLPQSDSD